MNRKLLIDDSRGIYIPKVFAESFDLTKWGFSESDSKLLLEDLLNPDSDWYWEAWEIVLRDACYQDDNLDIWYLEQDGDLFAVKEEIESVGEL
jgi:hypothetical protein